MKDWALAKGATHFTHWFQPLTGLTAEKHDSFINLKGESYDKHVVMNFSGKQLVKVTVFDHSQCKTLLSDLQRPQAK